MGRHGPQHLEAPSLMEEIFFLTSGSSQSDWELWSPTSGDSQSDGRDIIPDHLEFPVCRGNTIPTT